MILGTSRAVGVFAYPAPVDLRKGYDGLYGLVQTGLRRDPLSGELFLFVNLSRKLCKVLLWDGTGTENCWEHNTAVSTFPARLPGCG